MSPRIKVRRGASVSRDPVVAGRELYESVEQASMCFVLFHCGSGYDLDALGGELSRRFEGIEVVGCTTSGEIGPLGYENDSLVGVSFAAPDFRVATHRIDDLQHFEFSRGTEVGPALRAELSRQGASWDSERCFAHLLVDGMSMREEQVVSALHRGLEDVQLFGGSAGDGTRFEHTYVYHQGKFRTGCAVVALVNTEHPFCVFKTQHFVSNEARMVVTCADPARRVVTEINGEPAGREYARLVGLEVEELAPTTFAVHPVVVRLGGQEYVRSIQKVNPNESLTFFSAIDEGIVLTVARGVDFVRNLEETFTEVKARVGAPELVLGCDCVLRHLEMEQKGLRHQVARILNENNTLGFSTYGEQYNAMHVNQTLTGVAIGTRRA